MCTKGLHFGMIDRWQGWPHFRQVSGLAYARPACEATLFHRILTLLTDMEVCYKVFRADVLRRVHLREERFGFEPEVTAKVARLGVRLYEVGVSYSGRTYAEGKKIGWRDGLRALWCIIKYGFLGL